MDIIKVKVTTSDDIVTTLGVIKDKDPYIIDIPQVKNDYFDNYIRIQLQWNEQQHISEVDVVLDECNDGFYIFKKISSIRSSLERDYYRIDYKGIFKIKCISDSNKPNISRLLLNSSNIIKTSMASKVKHLLPHESTSDQHILKFLLELDSKLDIVIDLLSDKKDEVEYQIVNAIDVSGGGVCFFSKEIFNEGMQLYLDVQLNDTSNKVSFVTMGYIINIVKTDLGHIYSLEFDNLDTEFAENIIKYVFEKERKQIQELKNR